MSSRAGRLAAGIGLTATVLLAGPGFTAPGGRSTQAAPTAEALDLIGLEDRVRSEFADLVEGEFAACARAIPRFEAIARRADFVKLSRLGRRQVLIALLVCAPDHAAPEVARLAERLEPLAETDFERALVAFSPLLADLEAGRDLDAARRLATVLRGLPSLVADWEPPTLWPLVTAAEVDPALSIDLLGLLVAADWDQPATRLSARTGWSLRLARGQVEAGRLAEARQTLTRVSDVEMLLTVAADRRFEPIWPQMDAAGRFDWATVVEADVAARRKAVADHPRSLMLVIDLLDGLRLAGRGAEAIEMGQTVRRALATPDSYDDQAEETAYLLAILGNALEDARRHKEAEAVFREAVEAGDGVGHRIPPRLDLSFNLQQQGRPAEALAVLEQIADDASWPYAGLWRDANIVCIAADVDRPRAERLLAAMLPQEDENPAALGVALSCLDRLDETAAVFVRRLESPRHREQALKTVIVGRAPFSDAPFEKRQLANRRAILARPDVRAAIDRVGRRLVTPLKGRYFPE